MEIKPNSTSDKQPDTRKLLTINDKIHIVVVRTEPTGEQHLVGSHYMEWRGILCNNASRVQNSIEVNGTGAESNVPIGVLDIKMNLVPRLSQVLFFVFGV